MLKIARDHFFTVRLRDVNKPSASRARRRPSRRVRNILNRGRRRGVNKSSIDRRPQSDSSGYDDDSRARVGRDDGSGGAEEQRSGGAEGGGGELCSSAPHPCRSAPPPLAPLLLFPLLCPYAMLFGSQPAPLQLISSSIQDLGFEWSVG